MTNAKRAHYFVIFAFTVLYVITSLISTIHVVDFFALTNPKWLAIGLAIAFEIGAAASLASIIALHKMNKWIVWGLFLVLTAMQAMGNTYYAYVHAQGYTSWVELFGLVDEDLIYQKRILAIISGSILPIVALGFIKALVDYIKPEEPLDLESIQPEVTKLSEAGEQPTLEEPTKLSESLTKPTDIDALENKEAIILPTNQVESPTEVKLTDSVQASSTEPETKKESTDSFQLNNNSNTTVHRNMPIDEIIARGVQVHSAK